KQVANRALADGYGVVRVDLHGHARTLVQNTRTSTESLDVSTSYKTNVTDVIQVLKAVKRDYGIDKPYLVGHSYGGGIVTAVAAHPFGKYLISNEVTVIAPYIYRIDGYQAETRLYFLGGLPFLKLVKRLLPSRVRAQLESVTSDVYTDQFMQRL
ncbi:MAG: alpha/beta fold hydrolase, partial [Bdellovibrionales bacterium]|nr:alpha/beta hydrolase [Bdellovibrionales bacterium]NQZ19138.1 alpha/beta fold hydrolase [Bdellovibrionales bacterium]